MSDMSDITVFTKYPILNMDISKGVYYGEPIYIHYTSGEALSEIKLARKISATPNADRRGKKAKTGVYLVPAKDAMSSYDAHNLLFFCEEKYIKSADFCIIFTFKKPVPDLISQPVTSHGSVTEIISPNDIYFENINIRYIGVNPFITRLVAL